MSERLEEIRKDKALSNDDAVIKNSHYEWLIEQAERVDELIRAHELKDLEHQGLVAQLKKKYQQNKRYRNLLESLSKTRNIPAKIMKEQPDKKIIDANDILQYILRKINDELERGTE